MTDETTIQGQEETIGGGDGPSPEETEAWTEFEQEEAGTAAADGAASDDGLTDPEPDPADAQQSESAPADGDTPSKPLPGDEQSSPGVVTTEQAEAKIWENATPEQRSAFEKLQAEHADLTKRRQGQDRKIRELNENLIRASQKPAPSAKDGASGNAEPADLGENWGSFREDYPEIAGPVEEMLRSQRSEIDSLSRQLSSMGETAVQSVLDDNGARLNEVFPDYEGMTQTPEFAAWVETQPRMVHEALLRNGKAIVDYDEAHDILSRFKAATGQGGAVDPNPTPETDPAPVTDPTKKRERQLQSSRGAAPTRGGAVPTGVPEDGDPTVLWNQLEKAGL